MNAKSPLLRQVARFLGERQRQAPPRAGIVVAVSGGPDSVALLRALLAAAARPPLVIAHLNHRLRGAESDVDEEFVRQLHGSLQASADRLELACERIDVASAARTAGDNLESVARRVRYDWLAQVAARTGSGFVATGHTADDQAETVLHRLVRGTGLQGLRGIAVQRRLSEGIDLIRPLLTATRAEVLAYLDQIGQPYRLDSSNLDPRFLRNRLRRELLPLLARDYNPAISRLLAQLAGQAEEVYRIIEEQAGRLLADAELPRAGALLIFERARLAGASRHLVREAFRLAWQREGWPMNGLSFADWDRLAGLVFDDGPALDLPGGIAARCRGRVVRLGPGE